MQLKIMRNYIPMVWTKPQCKTKTTLENPNSKLLSMSSPPKNINLISCGSMIHVSDIKLIRTDTTLDLSRKAEKGISLNSY
ncbi:hypothetical protein ES319_D10G075800v1 [Gossypium barbadense]|uniref:Uncharacterized protein n=3 Tax=Gossypium TaxID=3633 RepID=A0A5J5PMS4_GOSBA|nr:hypothetical protein ES319_D10G075800v1 [Gossypium barbadense]TYG49260.1 hypothetical protein ES288_D10G080400v1 [Gossypium darwinii]TYH48645.1 hypothetical protein ES332_D10G081500v1 [Gossypium tomentosum]